MITKCALKFVNVLTNGQTRSGFDFGVHGKCVEKSAKIKQIHE